MSATQVYDGGDGARLYRCEDCGHVAALADLDAIDDPQERVAPGELAPAGQCPGCGALVGVADEQVPDYTLTAVALVMQARGWRVTPPADAALTAEVPLRLTAENGAKAALSSEFHETVEVSCGACGGTGVDDATEDDADCEHCEGHGQATMKVAVEWTTIKDIWKAGVALFAPTPPPPGGA